MSARRVPVLALTLFALVTGCSGAADAVEPVTVTPTPRVSVSSVAPSQTPTPSPTSAPVSVAEAEKTYRTIIASYFEATQKGGVKSSDPLPDDISKRSSGVALAHYRTFLVQVRDKGIIWKSGTYAITAVRQTSVGEAHPTAAIALVTCDDWRSVRSLMPDGKTRTGILARTVSWYMRDTDGTVKQIDRDARKVKTCDAR